MRPTSPSPPDPSKESERTRQCPTSCTGSASTRHRRKSSVGSRFSVYFGDAGQPAAVMEVTSDKLDEVAWRVVEGPGEWIDTLITFALRPAGSGRTTLLFSHAHWAEASEFMSGCTTNWGAYLTSMKTGAEGLGFPPYPGGAISPWG